MKLKVSECAKIAGVTARTIHYKIKEGELSSSVNEDGHKVVDMSELCRIYKGIKLDSEGKHLAVKSSEVKKENRSELNEKDELISDLSLDKKLLEKDNDSLKVQLEMMKEQVRKAEKREDDLLEISKSNTRLLENSKKRKFLGIF